MKKTLHLISHTHWDREWYMSFEKHRMKLVELMDCLIEKMEQDENFRYFHLDGQTIVIEDYLEIRPQMRDRLYALIKADRIQVGPWYILQDEYLTSGEANVRNMIEGLKFCEENGFEPVDCGYMPDAFGNIAQLPQILNGFDIKTAVFGRGVGLVFADNKADTDSNKDKEVIWYGADESRVDGLMFHSWYNNAWELPSGDMEEVKDVYGKLIDSISNSSRTPHLLGMNGCDHQPVQCDLPESIEKANEIFGNEVEIKHSNFKDYIKAVKPYVDSFPEIRGEIAGQNTKGTCLLIDTASTHIPLKQKNHATQNMFALVSEPVSTLASLYGDSYRTDMLRYGWKMLMQCHPHDSICCCSCDAVTREMDTRFDKAYDVAEGVLNEAMDYILAGMDTSAMADTNIAVFHTSPETTNHVIDKIVYTDEYIAPENIVIKDLAGNVCASEAEYLGEKFTYTLPKDRFRQVKFRQAYRLRFAVTLKGIGCFMYSLINGEKQSADNEIKLFENGAENENLSFVINSDGTLDLTEKKSGRVFKGINAYEDTGDCGESYNYKQTADGVTVYPKSAKVCLAENNSLGVTYKIESLIDIPAGLDKERNRTSDTITHSITTFVTLATGSDRLDIKTTINNSAENHRLRALFTTDIETETVFADGQFDVIKRNIKPWSGWENPSNTQRMQAFFGIEDEKGGLLVSGRGHNEYEILRDGKNTMAITLLRAIGEVGDWGDFPAPDMQLKKELTFNYSVIPYSAEEKAAAYRSAYTFAGDFVAVSQTDCHGGNIKANASIIEVEGDYIAYSTLKKAEKSDNAVLRIYNVSDSEQKAVIKLDTNVFAGASLTNLAETDDEALALSNGVAELNIAPKKIVTLILKK